MIAVALAAAAVAAPTDRRESLRVGGSVRTYLVHRPVAPGRLPLVLALHGYGESAADFAASTRWDALADRARFEVVYPEGVGRAWNDGREGYPQDDVGFVRALIGRLVARGDVDPRRVYATGFSNGAMMTYRLGCALPRRLAAIAPVAGDLSWTVAAWCRRTTRLLAIFGDADRLFPGGLGALPTLEWWARRRRCGPIVELDFGGVRRRGYGGCGVRAAIVVHGAHVWPPWATREIARFFRLTR